MRENHQKYRPKGAAAEGGRPIGAPPKAAPVCVCDYFIFYIINIYGYISYTFLIRHRAPEGTKWSVSSFLPVWSSLASLQEFLRGATGRLPRGIHGPA